MRLLDLFCGAGGCSVGYARAGFEVVGVDLSPQKNYPYEFIQADAIEWMRDNDISGFDAIHASPPCQAYSVANNIHARKDHPDLIEVTREALVASGKPYVIENVPGAPLNDPVTLCGLALGCNVKRHRLFEANFPIAETLCPDGHPGDWLLVFGHTVLSRSHVVGKAKGGGNTIKRVHVGTDKGREAMGIDWMNRDELSQAIPPAYTEHIAKFLIMELNRQTFALLRKERA